MTGANPDSNIFQWSTLTFQFAAVLAAPGTGPSKLPKANWVRGQNKGFQKTIRQMNRRGWAPENVTEAIQHGKRFPAENLVNKGNAATRYIDPNTGRSVVIDDVTREIIHVGGDGFKY